ncbi:ATP-binding protein [Metabacillus sp. JX24]|uniref:sensor histidine kinase n=1 Tax=Metabacillus sp. JX24 TaxID=3240759 RepID=UPI00350FA7CE
MKISHKIQLFSTVWMLIIVLGIHAAIYFLFLTITLDREVERTENQAHAVAAALKEEDGRTMNTTNLLIAYLPADGMIRIIDESSGQLAAVSKKGEYRSNFDPDYSASEISGTVKSGGDTFSRAAIPLIWTDGEVVQLEVTENLSHVDEDMDRLKVVLALASLFMLLPIFAAGSTLSRIILKPIHTLIQTMEEIQKKETFKKIETNSGSKKDELHQMTETFNKMIGLIQTNFEKQQQFVSDASHELKTPLTVIESYANLLKRWGSKKPEVLEEAVEAIYSEAVRMKEMTAQLLLLAENDAHMQAETRKTDAAALCRQTGKSLEQVYQRRVVYHFFKPEVMVSADELKLKQLLFILLDNAFKYSEEEIECTIDQKGNMIHLCIRDRGIGIPKEDLPFVFDRFFRVDKARTRGTGGTGLGLSIARKIVTAHDGEIRIDSSEGLGTEVHVYLPAFS